eukprot:Amastigsp_a677607_37.p6 type:complete len:104 gc:universal Amastigsp_a677607_37:598-287(-)
MCALCSAATRSALTYATRSWRATAPSSRLRAASTCFRRCSRCVGKLVSWTTLRDRGCATSLRLSRQGLGGCRLHCAHCLCAPARLRPSARVRLWSGVFSTTGS